MPGTEIISSVRSLRSNRARCGAFGHDCRCPVRNAISRSSISPSIASFEVATWSPSQSGMSRFRSRSRPGSDRSEEDRAAGPIRNHRSDTSRRRCLDYPTSSHRKGLPVPEPRSGEAAHVDQAVWEDRRQMGREHRARPETVRHAFNASDEGVADLQEDRQHPEPYSCFSVTRSSRAPSATSASKSMTRWRFLNRSNCRAWGAVLCKASLRDPFQSFSAHLMNDSCAPLSVIPTESVIPADAIGNQKRTCCCRTDGQRGTVPIQGVNSALSVGLTVNEAA